jgi:hypothetical protein
MGHAFHHSAPRSCGQHNSRILDGATVVLDALLTCETRTATAVSQTAMSVKPGEPKAVPQCDRCGERLATTRLLLRHRLSPGWSSVHRGHSKRALSRARAAHNASGKPRGVHEMFTGSFLTVSPVGRPSGRSWATILWCPRIF